MAKFHQTVSRRDFMKALGLGAAGVATASAVSPVFRDVDELSSSAGNINRNPWWVKERDFKKPTVPIDWSSLKRNSGLFIGPDKPDAAEIEKYKEKGLVGYEAAAGASAEQAEILYDYQKNEFPGYDWDPGYAGLGDPRSTAMYYMCEFMRLGNWPREMQQGGNRIDIRKLITDNGGTSSFVPFLGPRLSYTKRPEYFGATRWQGTPEENLKTVRAAFRFMGADNVCCAELDTDMEKFFHERYGGTGKYIKFVDDTDTAYEDDTTLAIPRSCKWMITWTARQPFEAARRQAGVTETFGIMYCYAQYQKIAGHFQEFLWALGYQCLNTGTRGYMASPVAILSGQGEHCRMSSPTLTPRSGVNDRAMWTMFTDLPLAPTPPH